MRLRQILAGAATIPVAVTLFAAPAEASNTGTPFITAYAQQLAAGGVGTATTTRATVPTPGTAVVAAPVLLTDAAGTKARPGCTNPVDGYLDMTGWYYNHALSYVEAHYLAYQDCTAMFETSAQATLSYNYSVVDSSPRTTCTSPAGQSVCSGQDSNGDYYAGGGSGYWVADIYTRATVPYGYQWTQSVPGCSIVSYYNYHDSLYCHVRTAPPIYFPPSD